MNLRLGSMVFAVFCLVTSVVAGAECPTPTETIDSAKQRLTVHLTNEGWDNVIKMEKLPTMQYCNCSAGERFAFSVMATQESSGGADEVNKKPRRLTAKFCMKEGKDGTVRQLEE